MTSAPGTPPGSVHGTESLAATSPAVEPLSRAEAVALMRNRRSLAASKRSRDALKLPVDGARDPKPPRAPLRVSSNASQHLSLPPSETETETERILRSQLIDREQDALTLKKLYGRALVKRRAAERERDKLRGKLAGVGGRVASIRAEDDARSVRSSRSIISSVAAFDGETQLNALVDVVEMLEARVAAAPNHPRAAPALARARATITAAREPRGHNADADPELDAAFAAAKPGHAAVLRAALRAARAETADYRARAEALARGSFPAAPSAVAEPPSAPPSAPITPAKATPAKPTTDPVANGGSIEAAADREAPPSTVAVNGATASDMDTAAELAQARRTIARLVAERNALRAVSAAGSPALDREPGTGPSSDVVRRVLDWREAAASEAVPPSAATWNGGRRAGVVTVPLADRKTSRPGRSMALDFRRLLNGVGGSNRGARVRTPLRGETRADERVAGDPDAGGRRSEQETSMQALVQLPDRMLPHLREPIRRRRVVARSLEAGSERSADVSEGSYHSQGQGIVSRHISADAVFEANAPSYGRARSDGLKGLIGFAAP